MDYVIVGGGIYGCLTAWEMARRGAEVLLLEADTIGAGASGGPGKRGVRANGRDLRELPLMARAYERWPSLHEELGAPTGYVQCGHLLLIERTRDQVGAEAHAWLQQQQGIPTERLHGPAIAEREPHLNPAIPMALYCPLDGVADQTATTRGAAAAAQRAGAEIREQSRVVALEHAAGRARVVVTAQDERFEVGKALILLNNGGIGPLLQEELGLYLPIWSRLPQVLFTESLPDLPLRHLIGHAHRRLAMKAGPDDSIMISGGWLGEYDDTGKARSRPDQVEGNRAEAVAVVPELAGAEVVSVHVDRPESECVDGIPVIDRGSGLENLYFATGWSGHGWAIAPAVCELMADWILRGSKPTLLAPFAFTRFGK